DQGIATILINGFTPINLPEQLSILENADLTGKNWFGADYLPTFNNNNLPNKIIKLNELYGTEIKLNIGFDISEIKLVSSDETSLILEITVINLVNGESSSKQITFSNFKAPLKLIDIKQKEIKRSELAKAIADLKMAITDEEKAAALSLVFNDVLAKDIPNFTFDYSNPSKIDLTAKDGYIFNGEFGTPADTLSTLEAINDVQIEITNKVINKAGLAQAKLAWSSSGDKAQKIAALNIVFNNVDDTNFEQFDVDATDANKFTLLAKLGYTFALPSKPLVEQLDSQWPSDLLIKIEVTNKEITPKELSDAKNAWTNAQKMKSIAGKISALNMVFVNVNATNFEQFDVDATDANKFILTAKPMYTFGEIDAIRIEILESQPPTVKPDEKINIKAKKNQLTFVENKNIIKEWNDWKDKPTDKKNKVRILNKLFIDVSETNLDYFSVEEIANTLQLTANDGYTFELDGVPAKIIASTEPIYLKP
ncbi:MAG: hypothetical protein KFW07_00945, partial [Mycoplasmataceae bacterium]|nr:hypothetical protein [Mycoplasmataceae bacterium]